MKFRFTFYYLLAIISLSCSDSKRQSASHDTPVNIKNKPVSGYTDTLRIDFPAAIFYTIDSIQLVKSKPITDTMIVESLLHDCYYQIRNARIVLKQFYPQVRIVDVKNTRFLLFEMSSGEKQYLDIDTFKDPCVMFIFNRDKKAEPVDMTNIETQLGFYFNR